MAPVTAELVTTGFLCLARSSASAVLVVVGQLVQTAALVALLAAMAQAEVAVGMAPQLQATAGMVGRAW